MGKLQWTGAILFLLVAILFCLVVVGEVTYFEDQSVRAFGRGYCLGEFCGGLFDPEVLESVDLGDGYPILGIYHNEGIATCYHDIAICILSQ